MFEVYGRITNISARTGIVPRLVISAVAQSKSSEPFDIVNLIAKVNLAFREGTNALSQEWYVGPAYPERWISTMCPTNEVFWTFIADLNPRLIQQIEATRCGRDVYVRLSLEVCGIERGPNDFTPKQVVFGGITQPGYQCLHFEVPRSKWLDTLEEMGYSKDYAVDIPLPRLPKTSVISPVLPRLQRAWEHFENGKDRETLAACWEAMEVLAKKQGGRQPGQNEFAQMLRGIGHQEKARRIADALRYWTDLLHLGRHEQTPSVEVDHRDAEFALIVTHACFAYLAKANLAKIGRAAAHKKTESEERPPS